MQIEEAKKELNNLIFTLEIKHLGGAEAIETILNELENAEKVIDKRNEEKLKLAEMNFTKSKVIDEMVKYIVCEIENSIIVKDICIKNAKELCFIRGQKVDCNDCIKEYFYKKVSE